MNKDFLGKYLATSIVIRLNLGDLLKKNLFMANLISFGVKCLTGLDGK
jgi:hypothetical protein